ncbi:uncharacterized protein LOC142143307 isoform X2 [Mixophyes fleayi]|uniref:uncharacterized protein LOC142143307 isoform X2 n=1 Tax=Mixophyes fleayi TaxID=3061075 RepID=UPI003F4E3D59
MRPAAFLLLLGLVLLSAVTADDLTCCLKERERADKKNLIGSYVPQCDENGYYSPKQCHGSTGMCWCVNAKGEEIAGTRNSPGQTPPTCGGTGEKPGKCSLFPMRFVCPKNPDPVCRSDWDCDGKQKCCDCNKQCKDPVGEKPGRCTLSNILIKCAENPDPVCRSDWDCDGKQKCCNCNNQCKDPVGNKPGECQVTETFVACEEDPNPACDSDFDCNGTQKCCDYACHMQCRDPIDTA